MPTITIRNIDDKTVRALKALAKDRDIPYNSVEEMLRREIDKLTGTGSTTTNATQTARRLGQLVKLVDRDGDYQGRVYANTHTAGTIGRTLGILQQQWIPKAMSKLGVAARRALHDRIGEIADGMDAEHLSVSWSAATRSAYEFGYLKGPDDQL